MRKVVAAFEWRNRELAVQVLSLCLLILIVQGVAHSVDQMEEQQGHLEFWHPGD